LFKFLPLLADFLSLKNFAVNVNGRAAVCAMTDSVSQRMDEVAATLWDFVGLGGCEM